MMSPRRQRRGRHALTAPRARAAESPGRSRAAAVVLVLLLVAAAAVSGALAVRRHRNAGIDDARTQAVAAARMSASDILGYDYRTVAADIARARRDTTGAFRSQYDSTAGALLPQAKKLRAIVQATVGSVGVMSAGADRVVVMLFVDQATVKQEPGTTSPVTRIDQSRVRMTMTKASGHWLVSELSAL